VWENFKIGAFGAIDSTGSTAHSEDTLCAVVSLNIGAMLFHSAFNVNAQHNGWAQVAAYYREELTATFGVQAITHLNALISRFHLSNFGVTIATPYPTKILQVCYIDF
jgi:hypothetical protein